MTSSPRQTVAVVGATGYVGRTLCDTLIEAGYQVRALSRPRPRGGERPSGEFRVIDVAVPRSLSDAFTGVDTVINLAGLSRANRDALFDRVNVTGAANVAAAARDVGVRRLVHLSHLAAQGPTPGDETPAKPGNEAPMDAHGRSRLRGEQAVLAEAPNGQACILRPAWIVAAEDHHLRRLTRWVRAGIAPTVPSVRLAAVSRADLCALLTQLVAFEGPLPSGPFFVASGEITSDALIDIIERNAGGRAALRLPIQSHWLRRAAPALDGLTRALGVGQELGQWVHALSAGSWTCSGDAARAELGFEPRQDVIRALSEAVRAQA